MAKVPAALWVSFVIGCASAFASSFRDGPLGPDPESRDSGFDAAHRSGMTF
jgi:hypothetical protein